ncbi:MAG: PP2C family protein-serine/threonine phosphatase [Planctomycetota bacterium]
MESEEQLGLALAAELQAALLPTECPTDCANQVAAARNRMCRSVGGDFYDFIRINDEQFVLVIGDVLGHGVRASLLMAQIMGYLRSQVPQLRRPIQSITALNRMLLDLGDKIGSVMLCSMFYALIDAPTGICFYINSGHPRPVLYQRASDESEFMGSDGMLLGVEDFAPEELCHTFMPGDRVVMYTDGVTEASNERGERFGQGRLIEIISRHTQKGPDELADAVFGAVEEFRGGAERTDDETIVVVDRT